jgi:Domain of unknown function (DUF5615)
MTAPRPRFLIDEQLSPSLAQLAHAHGYESQHVNSLGLRTKGDPILMPRILAEDWTLVTNNWREFMARYKAKAEVHAGLVLLLNADGIDEQRAGFEAALKAVDQQPDLVNELLYVEMLEDAIEVSRVPWPAREPPPRLQQRRPKRHPARKTRRRHR